MKQINNCNYHEVISIISYNQKTPLENAGFYKKLFIKNYSATTSKLTSVSWPLPKSIFAL